MAKILIVDDEQYIREVICEYAEALDYETFEAENGLKAIEMVKNTYFDCIVLDIMMPVLDGQSAAKEINAIADTPIIMLSARSEEEDKLKSFESGVVDYVTKPFSPKELMARIKVCIARSNAGKKSAQTNKAIKIYGISIDLDGHTVTVDGNEVHLTNKEFDLLVYLINNANTVVTRDILLEKIWGYDFIGVDRTVDTHIKMLRKNLGIYGNKILTIRGVGYKFEK